MHTQEELHHLKKEIKDWEYSFQRAHGSLPGKADVKSNSKIYNLYKSYKTCKAALSTNEPTELKSSCKGAEEKENGVGQIQPQTAIDFSIDDDTEVDEDIVIEPLVMNVELGPTPQAHGRILSIFDIKMTPPDSSPLVSKRATSNQAQNNETLFKTPTKPKIPKMSPSTSIETPVNLSTLIQKLQLAAQQPETPTKANRMPIDKYAVTPQYLAKNNDKFSFLSKQDNEGENALGLGQVKHIEPLTPLKVTNNDFLVSPSPLKTQRFFSKKISEIFNDFKSLQANEPSHNERNDQPSQEIDSDEVIDDKTTTFKKRKTQMRTTRRWKMKPRDETDGGDFFDGKNIHEVIEKMDEKEHRKLESYMNSDELDHESDTQPSHPTKKQGNGKKIKPISQNYCRLKINDPRSKNFKRRMNRR